MCQFRNVILAGVRNSANLFQKLDKKLMNPYTGSNYANEREPAMTIYQTLGDASMFVDEDDAKAEIKAIERGNRAIRDALKQKVRDNAADISTAQKRDEALQELRNENPLFRDAVDQALYRLLP
jgi:hypothetical protein